MAYLTGTLTTDLPCIFGLGKDFRRETASDPIPAGTEITSRFDANGWHKFTIEVFGRTATYAVRTAAILDTALGLATALSPREAALAEIRRLMNKHKISTSELN